MLDSQWVDGPPGAWRWGRRGAGQGGFSYLELVIVILILALLLAVVANRFAGLPAKAERAAVESFIGTLRSAIGIKVAEYLAKGELKAIAALAGSNPVDRLAEVPQTYVGALRQGDPAIQNGTWYFDVEDRHLVYHVKYAQGLRGTAGPLTRIRFVVEPVYEDRNGNGKFDQADMLAGVRLAPVERFVWAD